MATWLDVVVQGNWQGLTPNSTASSKLKAMRRVRRKEELEDSATGETKLPKIEFDESPEAFESNTVSGGGDLLDQRRFTAEQLFPQLVKAPVGHRQRFFRSLLAFSSPQAVSDIAFRSYETSCQEAFLLHAKSLLEAFGQLAWPVVLGISQSKRPECEIFVDLVSRFRGISYEDQLKVLSNFASHPEANVRLRVIEKLQEFPQELRKALLEQLARDPNSEIRDEARCQLD